MHNLKDHTDGVFRFVRIPIHPVGFIRVHPHLSTSDGTLPFSMCDAKGEFYG